MTAESSAEFVAGEVITVAGQARAVKIWGTVLDGDPNKPPAGINAVWKARPEPSAIPASPPPGWREQDREPEEDEAIADRGRMMVEAPGEGQDLVISDASRIGLRAYHSLAVTLTQAVGQTGLFRSSIASSLMAAVGAVVGQSLPDCPFAPAGVAVQPDWDPVTHNYMLRCQHPSHCWDRQGKYYSCP